MDSAGRGEDSVGENEGAALAPAPRCSVLVID